MAISKKFLKSKPVCKVTFELEGVEAETVVAVGDFNNWNTAATPLKKFKNGKFKTTVDLAVDESYEFKYVADGVYFNDEQADAFKWNDYASSDNGVLNV
jgi:1,4-alpha-glucan branching enzyme